MKRIFTLLLLLTFLHTGFASEKSSYTSYTSRDSVRYILSIVVKHTQKDFNYYCYPLIVHLYNKYQPDSLLVYPENYKKKIDPCSYKRLYLFSALMDSTNISSECMQVEESGEWNELYKLLFYSIYEGYGWNFPKNYVTQLEQSSYLDSFYGPVQALTDIYFLKQYKYEKLSSPVKKSITELENKLAKNVYENYIKNKPWSYRKVYALWAIRINKNNIADAVNENELTDFFDRKTWQVHFADDYTNKEMVKRDGELLAILPNLCTLWLFCLNK